MIGIKTADGKLFPVLEENERIKKRLVLTTVRDDQPMVHIDLYQGKGQEMEEAEPIGRLKIENVPASKKGEPDIELYLGVDPEGNLISKARVDAPEAVEQSLVVRLDEPQPRFETEEPSLPPLENGNVNQQLYFNSYATEQGEEKRRRNMLLGAAAVLAGVAVLFLLYFMFFRTPSQPQPTAPAATQPATPEPSPAQPKPEGSAPAQTQPAAPQPSTPTQPPPAVSKAPSAKVETKQEPPPVQKPPSVGVWYSTVKGDNLWNLARSFYRNPWLYKKIAEENNISNPNLILQDVRLYIPDVETGKR